MFESLAHVPGFTATYATELAAIEAASERGVAAVERETSKLARPDGSPIYTPAEHAERVQAILEAAGAQFDAATARYSQQSEREVADLEKKLAMLVGADSFDTLKPDEQQRASLRREFVREDVERLAPHQLADQARGAIARDDRASIYLWSRYLQGRQEPSLQDVLRELSAVFDTGDVSGRRRDLEAKLRAAQALPLAIEHGRRTFDGSMERALAGMRASWGL